MTALKEGDLVTDCFTTNKRIGVIMEITLGGNLARIFWCDGRIQFCEIFFLDRLEVSEALKK